RLPVCPSVLPPRRSSDLDVPLGEAGEVLRLAAAADPFGLGVDGRRGGGDVAGAGVLHRGEVVTGREGPLLGGDLLEDRFRQFLPEVEREVLDLRFVSGSSELIGDVLDGDLAAGEPGGAVAAV